jgi:hypothetical protein
MVIPNLIYLLDLDAARNKNAPTMVFVRALVVSSVAPPGIEPESKV